MDKLAELRAAEDSHLGVIELVSLGCLWTALFIVSFFDSWEALLEVSGLVWR